ncbi:MAG: exosome complex RNA-binding protein Csl4 [Candidatus Thorarchaeota archaeon]
MTEVADVKSGDIVVPGDQLCVIEEFSPSFGTYEENGIVYAATSGEVAVDVKRREIKVVDPDGSVRLALPIRGDVLLGEVINVYDQRAEVNIVRRNGVDIHNPLVGEIHISNVTRRYVKSMYDVLKPGDIVRARALNTHTLPVQLSLVGPEFGVIFAKCGKCGNPLTVTTHNNMICLKCENRETRETANDYGLRFGLEPRPDLAPRRRMTRGPPRRDRSSRPSTGRRSPSRPRGDRRSPRGRTSGPRRSPIKRRR